MNRNINFGGKAVQQKKTERKQKQITSNKLKGLGARVNACLQKASSSITGQLRTSSSASSFELGIELRARKWGFEPGIELRARKWGFEPGMSFELGCGPRARNELRARLWASSPEWASSSVVGFEPGMSFELGRGLLARKWALSSA